MSEKKVLINMFHPGFSRSRGNKALFEAATGLENVTVRDMYAEYPDLKIDVAREQELLLANDVIVFQHPLFWMSAPPLLKHWQDSVLQAGFAFPPGVGTKLAGKLWQSVITTGGPAEGYTREGPFQANFEDILVPYKLTSLYCSMQWQEPFAVTSVMTLSETGEGNISDEDLQKKVAEYRALLESY